MLARLLLAYAALLHMLLSVFAAPKTMAELKQMCREFLSSEQARKDLSFDDGAITAALKTIEPYVLRLKGAKMLAIMRHADRCDAIHPGQASR